MSLEARRSTDTFLLEDNISPTVVTLILFCGNVLINWYDITEVTL